MELKEYRKSFLESVKSSAAGNQDGTIASFVDECASLLLDINIIPDYELSFYTGTGKRNRRLRVDGYALDDYDWTVSLFIADYYGEDELETLTRTRTKQVFERLSGFLDEAMYGKLYNEMEISTPAYDLVDLLKRNKAKIRKYKYFLITDKIASDRIENLPAGELREIPVEYHIWDMSRFFRVSTSITGRDELEIDFCEYMSQGIPCLEASTARTEMYRSFLCVLPGETLADIYDKYGSRLLEGNVRSFLNTKVAVNKKIRETIIRNPEMFFAYNNGISATATEVLVENKEDGRYITQVRDLQIVNGGQTTASLSTARYRDRVDISKIYVQMKLTEVEPNTATIIIPNISRSSNSQNKVGEADFFSNHAFHIRMEQISRRVFAPAVKGSQYDTYWFYERARGQYLQTQARMTKNEKAKFLLQNPKNQVITKTDLAKYYNSWQGLPHKVSFGAQKNFVLFAERIADAWEENDDVFNDLFYKEMVAKAILFRNTEKLVSAQPWYEKGYRANIVTYSVALLAYLIKKKYKNLNLDLQMIWAKQGLPESLGRQMAILAKNVFDILTSDNRAVQNVTEWSKREGCWNQIKALESELIPEADEWLVGKGF